MSATRQAGSALFAELLPWLGLIGLLLLVWWWIKGRHVADQGSGAGGVLGAIADTIGGTMEGSVASQETVSIDNASVDLPSSTNTGVDALAGEFLVQSGGTVNRQLLASTTRIPFLISNAGALPWRGVVRLVVHWSFLTSDEDNTWEETLRVEASSSSHVEADVAFPTVSYIRPPVLTIELQAGERTLARVEGVEVS